MPRNPIDTDPTVVAARQLATERASLAQQLAIFAEALGVGLAGDVNDPGRLVDLAGTLAHLARDAEQARDVAVQLARTLPESDRPSWQRLADAMGEPDRNNLARRYRTRKVATDE